MSDDTSQRTDAAVLSESEELRTLARVLANGEAIHWAAICLTSADTIDRLTRERDTLRRALEAVSAALDASDEGEVWRIITQAIPEPREPEAARTEPTCVCGHPESDHETIEYRGDKSRSCVENRQGPSAERCPCMCYQPAAPEPKEPQP
jgi:hypothetical protein